MDANAVQVADDDDDEEDEDEEDEAESEVWLFLRTTSLHNHVMNGQLLMQTYYLSLV